MRWNEKNRTATPRSGSWIGRHPITLDRAVKSRRGRPPGRAPRNPSGASRRIRPGTIRTSERRQEQALRQVFRPTVLVSLVVAALLVSGIAVAGSALRDEKTTKRAQPTTTTAAPTTTTTAPAPTTTTLP